VSPHHRHVAANTLRFVVLRDRRETVKTTIVTVFVVAAVSRLHMNTVVAAASRPHTQPSSRHLLNRTRHRRRGRQQAARTRRCSRFQAAYVRLTHTPRPAYKFSRRHARHLRAAILAIHTISVNGRHARQLRAILWCAATMRRALPSAPRYAIARRIPSTVKGKPRTSLLDVNSAPGATKQGARESHYHAPQGCCRNKITTRGNRRA